MRVLSLLLAGMVFWSSVWAVSTEDILELLSAELDEETTTSDTATIDDITLEDLTHDEIIESFHDETYITREQFAYMLDLLTDDIDTVRDMDRCNFRDYETAQSILGLAAVNTLCHKGIVRGTYQTRYYYGAKLTEAEAVTMVVRALYLDEYDELKLAEASAPQGQRYKPYYTKALANDIIVDGMKPYGSLSTLSPATALSLLQHNFGSITTGVTNNPLSTIIYQTIHDDERAHVVWWIRDRNGEELNIDDDSIEVSLDPYRSILDDDDVFVSQSCDLDDECITKIEFDIDRESTTRSSYCGTMIYTIDSPYDKDVEEDFCLDR